MIRLRALWSRFGDWGVRVWREREAMPRGAEDGVPVSIHPAWFWC